MKASITPRSFYLFLTLSILLSGCATTTQVKASSGAEDKRDSSLVNVREGLKTNNSGNPKDSLANNHAKKFIFHFGIGGGFGLMSKGHDTVLVDRNIAGLLGMHFTFILPGNWGGNISCKGNITKSKDVPSDYYDDGARVFSPKD
jgi:hypothetical protein